MIGATAQDSNHSVFEQNDVHRAGPVRDVSLADYRGVSEECRGLPSRNPGQGKAEAPEPNDPDDPEHEYEAVADLTGNYLEMAGILDSNS